MSENKFLSRLTSGGVGKTLLKLAIISIIVGAVFKFIGVSPKEFWRGVFTNVQHAINRLGESFGEIALTLLSYLAIGAAIVIPIWLVGRLWSSRK